MEECLCLCVCMHGEARRQLWGSLLQTPSPLSWTWGLSLDWNSPSGRGLLASKLQRAACLYFGSGIAGVHVITASFILCGFWRSNSGLHACKASTLPSELSFQPPWKILRFEEPKHSTALNDSCFEWGAVFRSTPSHNKHNYLVKIQRRWWGCTLSQSKLWSDTRVVTYGPCVTCFYKPTFIGIQQPSLYCCSVCFCANPSWAP